MKEEKHLCGDNCNNIDEVEDMVPTSTEELLSTEQQKKHATEMLFRYFRAENGTIVNAFLNTCITGLSNRHNTYFLQLTFKKLADVEKMESS